MNYGYPVYEIGALRVGRRQGRRKLATTRRLIRACGNGGRDAFAVEWIDDRRNYGEERLNLLGMCQGTLLYVAFTERGERTRISSARRAERHEQDRYFQESFR